MQTEKITAIVPCWNYGMFLKECLDSLVNQTVLPAHIIIADDASTDSTPEITRTYAKNYPGLFGWNRMTERQGTIKNENFAATMVQTPWMFYLDADDKVDPTYIEKVLAVIDSHDEKLGIVYSDMTKFGNWDGIWRVSEWDPKALEQGNYINGHSVFRTELFRAVGGLREIPGFEDHQMWVDMVNLGTGIYGVRIPEPLVWYRRHDFGHRTDRSDIDKRKDLR